MVQGFDQDVKDIITTQALGEIKVPMLSLFKYLYLIITEISTKEIH